MSERLMAVIRRRYGGSVGAAAKDIGVNRVSLWRLATGRTANPQSALLLAVSKRLRIPTHHLLPGDSNDSEKQRS